MLLWSLDRWVCCAVVKPRLVKVVVGPYGKASGSGSQTSLYLTLAFFLSQAWSKLLIGDCLGDLGFDAEQMMSNI